MYIARDHSSVNTGTRFTSRPVVVQQARVVIECMGVVLKKKWGGRLKQDLDKDFKTI